MEQAGHARNSQAFTPQGEWRDSQGPGKGSAVAPPAQAVFLQGAASLFVCISAKLLPRVNLCFTTYFQADFFCKQVCVCSRTVMSQRQVLPCPQAASSSS